MSDEMPVDQFLASRKTKKRGALAALDGRSEIDAAEYQQVLAALTEEEKRRKFGNIPVKIDGIWFDSGHEGNRYVTLKHLAANGEISNLERQQTYHLNVNGIHICDYICDFHYLDADGKLHVEDAKGVQTPKFKLQKKLMLAVHGIEVELV